MDIQFEGEYKSLKNFEANDLPALTVITGKNGSGKTHLLELLTAPKVDQKYLLELNPPVHQNEKQFEGLDIDRTMSISLGNWRDALHEIKQFFGTTTSFKELVEKLIAKSYDLKRINGSQLLSVYSDQEVGKRELEKIYLSFVPGGSPLDSSGWDFIWYRLSDEIARREKAILYCDSVAKFLNKKLSEVKNDDIDSVSGDHIVLSTADLFRSEIHQIIYFYYKRRYDNIFQKFIRDEFRIENNAISDEDFVAKYRKPEDLFNEILEHHRFPYFIKSPNVLSIARFQNFEFPLYKKGVNMPIKFDDLSSGEKTILGLISKVFYSKYFNCELACPKLLLLDEPDKSLHPEMSKLLIDVMIDTFIGRFGINIVMTTHSPSTIALTPEENIFQLKNEPTTELKKISKDEALNMLTQNLPTLSIDYKNHRQIFVESQTDLSYYQQLFDKIYCKHPTTYRLYFIANNVGKSNCNQVIKITNDLRNSGNKSVWGIIDWDRKNKNSKFIHVHGESKRYTIENYLCDPIYLAALFIKQNANKIVRELNLSRTYQEQNIGSENNIDLQKIADWVIEKVEEKNHFLTKEKQRCEVEYHNGKVLLYPKWLLETQGHILLEKIKSSFPSLERVNENELKEELILVAIKCYPFVAKESVELLLFLASN